MSLRKKADALKENITIDKSLPNPRIAFGYNDSDGFNNFMIGNHEYQGSKVRFTFTQLIPFPTKLFLKSKIAKIYYGYSKEITKSEAVSTVANVKNYYYRLAQLENDISIIKSDSSLLKLLEKNTDDSYAIGEAKETDVIRIELKMIALKNQLISLKKDRLKILYDLSRLSGIKLNKLKGTAVLPHIAKLKAKKFRNIIKTAFKNNPLLKAANFLYKRSKYEKKLADQGLYPNIIFHVKYGYRYDIQPALGGSIGLEIPLYFNQRQFPEMDKAKKNMISSMFARNWEYSGVARDIMAYAVKIKKYYKLYETEKKIYLPESSLLLKLYISRYIFGKTSAFELLNSFKKMVKAELLSNSYEVNFLINRSDLLASLGKISPINTNNY
ncbi:MAG: TolC family protein [Deltaproteobacteria bacterium]|jgi:outer membrane protein TolC|nr:TolC family protein [Deltaproteobacteria bacterium]MCL5879831.1 TolC family protein [Deltaproteobacteria bacterium]MDA8303886.1 TolC family protein [Deltaproteobacteria bacterium]